MTLCTKPPPMESNRPQRRPGRPPIGKKMMNREIPGKLRSAYRRSLDPCDNSNDSGLGFDHHHHNNNNNDGHLHHHASLASERLTWNGERAEAKRLRLDIKMEDEEANDSYCFPPNVRQCKDNMSIIRTAPSVAMPSLSISNNSSPSSNRAVARCNPIIGRQVPTTPASLTTQLPYKSQFGDIALTIVKQPEQQHRARYQTEGSRGAVKDRDGNGFPMVQLTGYYKPATLQVYIGTDVGKVAPHMFYQACKVSGKNSTPCYEKKIDGTCVIELALDPAKEMCANCDCVGILKERNVDVEHRFPDQLGNRNKKKSTRCRMIFRTTITHDNGNIETLQVCSQPIVCTQPPGIPEICKKSLTSCPASGGLELFVLGKNFLKDTKVYFQQFDEGRVSWEQAVVPDKEYLQQTHFVCVVPPYRRPNITEPVSVKLCVVSSGKTSDMHQFVYTPVNGAVSVQMEAQHTQPNSGDNHFFKGASWNSRKREHDLDMMPPPESNMVPISSRRSSLSLPSTSDAHSPPLRALKQEYIDENSQSSLPDPLEIHTHERYRPISESSLDVNHDSNISMINDNSIDMLHHNHLMAHLNDNSNLSVNEDSVEMARRSSMSENAEATVLHSMVSEVPPSTLTMMLDKGMDLRMKQSLNATVTDYVTNASSMATLKSFGIEPTSAPLPTQSAQSVENYLTKIESKSSLIPGENIPSTSFSPIKTTAEKSDMMSCTALTSALGSAPASTQSVFLPTMQQPFVSEATTVSTIAKSEAAAIAEQTLSGITNTSNTNTTITSTLEGSISTSINAPIEEIFHTNLNNKKPEHSQNVLLTTEPPMLVPPPPINSTIASPVLQGHRSPEIMMNPQMSTGILMRNTPEQMLDPAVCQAGNVVTDASILPSAMTVPPLMPSNNTRESSTLLNAEPEKAVLLEAAADLFKTQKKINELTTVQSIMSLTPSVTESAVLSMPNCYVQSYNSSIAMSKTLSDHIPMPVKDISPEQSDKKNEDRIMAQAFTSLSENDLIDFINPSCFDQGNYNQ